MVVPKLRWFYPQEWPLEGEALNSTPVLQQELVDDSGVKSWVDVPCVCEGRKPE